MPPLGTELPEGARFIGPRTGRRTPNWRGTDHPADVDLDSCVACGLCLPHCPTYRLTGEESASPRGRIAAMRSVADGIAEVDDTFASFMDLCLVCRACEDVCPSHVPFGRMMERARVQIEPLRSPPRAVRCAGSGSTSCCRSQRCCGSRPSLQPVARPFMPRRMRALAPTPDVAVRAAAASTEPPAGVDVRGTVAVLVGLRAGPLVPRGEPRHDPRARAQRLARRGAARPALLRSARRRTTDGWTPHGAWPGATRRPSPASTTWS